jgi:hypothetical protein
VAAADGSSRGRATTSEDQAGVPYPSCAPRCATWGYELNGAEAQTPRVLETGRHLGVAKRVSDKLLREDWTSERKQPHEKDERRFRTVDKQTTQKPNKIGHFLNVKNRTRPNRGHASTY